MGNVFAQIAQTAAPRYTLTLTDGSKIIWKATHDSAYYLTVWSESLGKYGTHSYQAAVAMSESGIRLCERLAHAPDFVFARIGLEVDTYHHEDYLEDYREEGEAWVPHGMILSEQFWKELGEPEELTRFRPGYWWRKYQGERVNPVFTQNDLYQQWKKLPG